MKRIGACLIVILFATFTLPADESDVIVQAQTDATEDGKGCHAFWWGVGGATVAALPVVIMSFFGSALSVDARRTVAFTAPVVGGAGLALIGYLTGRAEVPDTRIAKIQDEYGDSSLLPIYESEYVKALTTIQRRKRGNSALIGFGVSVSAMGAGFLVVLATK